MFPAKIALKGAINATLCANVIKHIPRGEKPRERKMSARTTSADTLLTCSTSL